MQRNCELSPCSGIPQTWDAAGGLEEMILLVEESKSKQNDLHGTAAGNSEPSLPLGAAAKLGHVLQQRLGNSAWAGIARAGAEPGC